MKQGILIAICVMFATKLAHSQWLLGGNNFASGLTPANNIIGTDVNLPLRFETNSNPLRMHINEQLNFSMPYLGGGPAYLAWLNLNYGGAYGPMGVGFKPEGFIGINTSTPRTRLHIAGPTTSGPGTGWRPWMSTGVYMNEQSNNMYVGMYKKGDNSASDAMVNWGDDGVGGPGATNRLRINFTPSIGLLPGTPPIENRDMEMMSFWANRRVGIGDFVNFTNGPQRHLHLHNAFAGNDFIQITNTATIGGNNPPINSGFHLGNANATASLIQYENNHIVAYTNIAGAGIGERMRITHLGAPGVNNPGGLANNQTKIGISLDPTAPVTSPLSLLHLGYNTAGAADGWRPWMANGMFVSQASDNVFIGLKQENYFFPTINRFDAVINWGDDILGVPPIAGLGPDNLRFIFTSFAASGDAASGTDGLEVARFSPNCQGCPNNKPSFGIGNFAPSGPQGPGTPDYINATLHVDGDAIIEQVTQDDNVTKVLVWDNNDHNGRIKWRDANTITPGGSGGTITANNGLHMQTPTEVHLGGTLSYDTYIDLDQYELEKRFVDLNGNLNRWAVGTNAAGIATDYRQAYSYSPGSTILNNIYTSNVGQTHNVFENNFTTGNILGLVSNAYATSSNAIVVGVESFSQSSNGNATSGKFRSWYSPGDNIGVDATAFSGSTRLNSNNQIKAVVGNAHLTSIDPNTAIVAGGHFSALNHFGDANVTTYGIYASGANGGGPLLPTTWAGYFDGNVHVNGTLSAVTNGGISDQIFKTNIDSISNAQQIISQLTPRTFYFDTTNVYGINFPSSRQYGFVAQEVEPILPELISETRKSAVYDSLGNIINPSIDYKTLNYDAMIALLMKGMQEQQSVIENLTQQLNDLNAIVNNCCAQGNNIQAPSTNNPQTINYQPNVHQRDVKLTDTYCVLGENSPNPFRDHTVINYELAETIQSAQIVFYNMVGQIIKVIEINERGLGRLNVYGEDLRSGMYTYSLIIDGNVCETKKMIKE